MWTVAGGLVAFYFQHKKKYFYCCPSSSAQWLRIFRSTFILLRLKQFTRHRCHKQKKMNVILVELTPKQWRNYTYRPACRDIRSEPILLWNFIRSQMKSVDVRDGQTTRAKGKTVKSMWNGKPAQRIKLPPFFKKILALALVLTRKCNTYEITAWTEHFTLRKCPQSRTQVVMLQVL